MTQICISEQYRLKIKYFFFVFRNGNVSFGVSDTKQEKKNFFNNMWKNEFNYTRANQMNYVCCKM